MKKIFVKQDKDSRLDWIGPNTESKHHVQVKQSKLPRTKPNYSFVYANGEISSNFVFFWVKEGTHKISLLVVESLRCRYPPPALCGLHFFRPFYPLMKKKFLYTFPNNLALVSHTLYYHTIPSIHSTHPKKIWSCFISAPPVPSHISNTLCIWRLTL